MFSDTLILTKLKISHNACWTTVFEQTAALALGRLANYNDDLAEAVVKSDILPQLVYSLAEQNRFYKKAAAFVLRAVAKHSPQAQF